MFPRTYPNQHIMSAKCPTCGKAVYHAEEIKAIGKSFHRRCLKCAQCNKTLDPGSLNDRNDKVSNSQHASLLLTNQVYCKMCYGSVAGLKGFRGGGGTEGTVLASVSGGAAGNVTYSDANVETESALAKGYTTGYRMVGDAGVAGPSSAHTVTVMTEDTGKFAGASGTSTSGYRMAGDVAGPTSAHANYAPTEDQGIYRGTTGSHSTGYAQQSGGAKPKFCPNCGTKAEGGKFCASYVFFSNFIF